MKQIIKVIVIAIAMMAPCVTALAQQTNAQRINRQQRISREQLAEVEAKHIARVLAFNDDVTEKFITTYCNYQKEIWALGPRQHPSKQGNSERENEERIKLRFAMSENLLNIRQKYYKKKALPTCLMQAGRAFKVILSVWDRFTLPLLSARPRVQQSAYSEHHWEQARSWQTWS